MECSGTSSYKRQPNCPVCGDNQSIKHLIDYEQFCGARASDKVGLVRMFWNIGLRGRQPNCPVCGDNQSIKHVIDYEQFCGARASDKVGLVRMFWNIKIQEKAKLSCVW